MHVLAHRFCNSCRTNGTGVGRWSHPNMYEATATIGLTNSLLHCPNGPSYSHALPGLKRAALVMYQSRMLATILPNCD